MKSMLMYRDVLAVLPTAYGKSFIFQAYLMAREQLNKQRQKCFHPGNFPAYQHIVQYQLSKQVHLASSVCPIG